MLESAPSTCWKGDLLGSKAFDCVCKGGKKAEGKGRNLQCFSAEGIIQTQAVPWQSGGRICNGSWKKTEV